MYVAVTRARQRLYLSFAQTRMLHGQTRYNLPSRFFDEIPAALLKWLTPKFKASTVAEPHSDYAFSRADSASGSLRSARQEDSSGFRIGQNVMHGKFGLGVIINAEGSGPDSRVQVNFSHAGMKWLALSVAKLTPA